MSGACAAKGMLGAVCQLPRGHSGKHHHESESGGWKTGADWADLPGEKALRAELEVERARADRLLEERDAARDNHLKVMRERDQAVLERDALRVECDRRECLLTLYRVKLSTDGLNGRPWDATAHLAAVESLAAAGEKALAIDSYESLGIVREMVECAVEGIAKLSAPAEAGKGQRPPAFDSLEEVQLDQDGEADRPIPDCLPARAAPGATP